MQNVIFRIMYIIIYYIIIIIVVFITTMLNLAQVVLYKLYLLVDHSRSIRSIILLHNLFVDLLN